MESHRAKGREAGEGRSSTNFQAFGMGYSFVPRHASSMRRSILAIEYEMKNLHRQLLRDDWRIAYDEEEKIMNVLRPKAGDGIASVWQEFPA